MPATPRAIKSNTFKRLAYAAVQLEHPQRTPNRNCVVEIADTAVVADQMVEHRGQRFAPVFLRV